MSLLLSSRIADGDTPANNANWLFFGSDFFGSGSFASDSFSSDRAGREGLDLAVLSREASVFSVED